VTPWPRITLLTTPDGSVAIAVLGSNNEHPTTKDKPIRNARIKRTMCSSRQLQCRDSILSEAHVHLLPLRVLVPKFRVRLYRVEFSHSQGHKPRRRSATLIYRRTGNLRAVQLLLGHRKVESTVRYLGIEVDDALAIAEQVDV
jgi:site-specific recombinase XerC